MLLGSRTLLPTALVLAVACGGDRAPIVSEKGDVVKEEKKDADFDQRMADRKAKREADAQAKADADKAKAEAFEKITIVPAKKPKKIEAACEEVGKAQDRFMQRLHTGEVLAKWNADKGAMLMTQAQCNKVGSIEVAACQIHALDQAPPELKEDALTILQKCTDKFAPPPSAGDAKIPRKKGG
jgi:hypothetical protein